MKQADEGNTARLIDAASALHLGARIRTLRQRGRWTLDDLAARAEVSKAMLSKIERGEVNPSLVITVKIAASLAVTVSELLGVDERPRARKVTRQERLTFHDPQSGTVRQIFPGYEGGLLDLMWNVLPPGTSSGDSPPHRRMYDVYILVEAGVLTVQVGSECYDLESGDTLYFRADVVHRFTNQGQSECRYLAIGL